MLHQQYYTDIINNQSEEWIELLYYTDKKLRGDWYDVVFKKSTVALTNIQTKTSHSKMAEKRTQRDRAVLAAYQRQWRARNKEHIREYRRTRYLKDPEKFKMKRRERYLRARDSLKAKYQEKKQQQKKAAQEK